MVKERILKEVKTLIGENTLRVKKGDTAMVTIDGYKVMSGQASGKILHFNENDKTEGYNYENISKMIVDRINRVFNLEEYMENEEIDFDELVDEVTDVLTDYF